VIVCTRNSISSISRCLTSLRQVGVGEVIVVDAASTDGTRDVAEQFADTVLTDGGSGLGAARNIGIAASSRPLVLNLGSDNVLVEGCLEEMIECLVRGGYSGVSAGTLVEGSSYGARGLNAWRRGRFVPGPTNVIGTPTLFIGELLRRNPYNPQRAFSDDSELCERWIRDLDAGFAISDAHVLEVGKTSLREIRLRSRMYGESDYEVFTAGVRQGWSRRRICISLLHPLRVDVLTPLRNLPLSQSLAFSPFLLGFSALRYLSWAKKALRR